MSFVRKTHYRKEGRIIELSLDRFGNFVAERELEDLEVPTSSEAAALERFFAGDAQPEETSELQTQMFARFKKMLAKGISISEVRRLIGDYELAVLRAEALGGRTPGAVMRRAGITPDPLAPLRLGAPVGVQPPQNPVVFSGVKPAAPTTSEAEQAVIDRFLRPDAPCFFPGCEALRGELASAINASGGEQCPSCTRSQIESQFSERALKAWRSSTKDEDTPTPPVDHTGDHVVSDDVVQS